MFFFSITVIYFLLNLYSLIRIRKLFKSQSVTNVFSFLFVILTMTFPVAEIIAHTSYGASIKYLMLPGYYSLPFLLYIFMIIILYDILLIINHFFKVVSRKTIESVKCRAAMLCIIFLIPLMIVISGTINYNTIRVSEYNIDIPRKSSKLRNIKVSLVADFHLRDITGRQFIADFVKIINSLKPDILLMPGDILEGDNQNIDTADFEQLFKGILTKYGVYASPGNHESHGGKRCFDFLKKANVIILQDEYLTIADSLFLVGRKDEKFEKRKQIREILNGAPGILPVLVIDHRPLNKDYANDIDIDIQLSGHTHNGQLFPFNLLTKYLNILSWGYKKIGKTHLFVTSGIQGWGPPVRTTGFSEIMMISINFI